MGEFSLDVHANMTEKEVRDRCRELSRSCFRLRENNDQLRAALREIIDVMTYPVSNSFRDPISIARAALGEGE